MSFDPSNYSVRNATKELDGMSLEDLESVLEQEVDGKHRSSLIAEIGRHIDAIKTVAEQYEEAPKPVAPSVAVAEEIGSDQFMLLRSIDRRAWKHVGPNRFVKVG